MAADPPPPTGSGSSESFWRKLSGRDKEQGSQSDNNLETEPRRRVSRQVVPGLPRGQTFGRQQSDIRDRLEPLQPRPAERRAASADRIQQSEITGYISSKSSHSSIFKPKTRDVKSWERRALDEGQAARPTLYQWKCSMYNLTWDDLEQFLRLRFPSETFEEFQSGDYWIFNAPEPQTQKDYDDLARLRLRSQPQSRPRRDKSLEPLQPALAERRAVSADRSPQTLQTGSQTEGQELANQAQTLKSFDSDNGANISSSTTDDQIIESRVTGINSRAKDLNSESEDPSVDIDGMTSEQYDDLIHEELDHIWILNLSMHFKDKEKREKLFITYIQSQSRWRRVTVALDYGDAPANSLEADLAQTRLQRDKSAKIYEAIRESLVDIDFWDTVTNLKLQTLDGRLHVHVTEDVNEIIHYPSLDTVLDIPCRHIAEDAIKLDSHISGFVYKVTVDGQTLARKDISGPDRLEEFVKHIRALSQLHGSRFVIDIYGLVLSQDRRRVIGYLMPYCDGGALIDVIYDNAGKLPWPRRERWARQIVIGLSQIHEYGIVHGNLVLSKIALDDHDDISILGVGTLRTAVGWEPPEDMPLIESNQNVALYKSFKSDIYQLGMVLWALASQEDEPEAHGRPLRVTEEMGVPAWYKLVVEMCLSQDPRQRPPATSLLDMWGEPEPDVQENFSGPGPDSEAKSEASSSSSSSVVDEDEDDGLFETASIASIATSISTNSTSVAVIKDATTNFADLLDESMDLTSAIRNALEQKKLNPDALKNGVRRLLKLLSRDLSSELPMPEYRDVCNFFMSFSREISSEILNRAGVKTHSDADGKSPANVEAAAPRAPRIKEKIIELEVFDDESDAEGEGPVSAPRPQISLRRQAVASSDAFRLFLSSLRTLIYPTFESRLKRMGQVAAEKAAEIDPDGSLAEIVAELLYSQPLAISLTETKSTSWTDMGKCWIENYTQQEWDWWPLRPAQARVGSGKARLRWQCLCGEIRTAVLPEGYARYILKIRQETMHAPSSSAPQTSTQPTSAPAAAAAIPGTAQYSSQSNSGASQSSTVAGRYTPLPQGNISNISHAPGTPSPSQDRYVLFVVPASALHLREIESKMLCNEGLFRRIREEYYQAKGWLRNWFGLMVYSHCDFYKFEAWYTGRYCERDVGIPAKDDQDYFYVPKPMDRDPPLSRHEFYDRFYKKVNSEDCVLRGSGRCAERDAVERIPQKKDLVSTAGNTRPQFYGIIAREKKSGLRMGIYILVSSIPGVIFFFLWLFQWGHDSLQDASVLLMISFTLLGLLYAAQLL